MKKSLVYTILFLIGLCFTVITVKYIINYVNRPQISIKICRITEFDSSGLMVEDVNELRSFYSIGKSTELDIRDEENKQIILSESDVGQLIEVHYNGTFESSPAMFVSIKKNCSIGLKALNMGGYKMTKCAVVYRHTINL